MRLPNHKTKIVCTIGPASRSEAALERLMLMGMNVARLNFAHGILDGHRQDIRRIRAVAEKLQHHCMIMVDLPGPCESANFWRNRFCWKRVMRSS